MSRRRRPGRGPTIAAGHPPRPAGRPRVSGPPSPPAAVGTPTARDWGFIGVVTAAAVLTRLLFPVVWAERTSLGSAFYLGDVRAFTGLAAARVAGLPFDNGVPFHPPGWGLVLAGVYAAAGFDPVNGRPVDPVVVKAAVAVVSGLACGASTLLALLVAGRGAAAIAAMASVFHFGHMVQGTVPNAEPLYGLLVTLVVMAAVALARLPERAVGRGRVAAWTGVGVLAGATALVRAEFLLGLVLLAAYVIWRHRTGSRRLVAALTAGVVIVLAPSTIAHWRSIDAFNRRNEARLPAPLQRFAPVTSYGAFSFAMANHPEADGGPNSDHPLLVPETDDEAALLDRGDLDLSVRAVHRLYVDGYRLGLGWWLAHPGDAAALVAQKIRLTVGALALGYGPNDWPAGVNGTRRRVDLFEPDALWLVPIHLALLAAGWLGLVRREPRAAAALAIPLVTLAASVVLYYGYVRLGVAYLPIVWPLQAAAVAALGRRLGVRPALAARPYAAACAGLLAGVAIAVTMTASPRTPRLDGLRDERGQVFADDTVRVIGAR